MYNSTQFYHNSTDSMTRVRFYHYFIRYDSRCNLDGINVVGCRTIRVWLVTILSTCAMAMASRHAQRNFAEHSIWYLPSPKLKAGKLFPYRAMGSTTGRRQESLYRRLAKCSHHGRARRDFAVHSRWYIPSVAKVESRKAFPILCTGLHHWEDG